MAEATYKINNSHIPYDAKCVCGHSPSAHGSNGFICAACPCKKFEEERNEANRA